MDNNLICWNADDGEKYLSIKFQSYVSGSLDSRTVELIILVSAVTFAPTKSRRIFATGTDREVRVWSY
jgi:hypothetical protein